MYGYVKLFSDILHSTIWREKKHVKIVWITMLAMSDRHGHVMASIPGLADASKVSVDETLDALKRLSEPDPYSRTKDYDGRRITEIDGGWLLLNHEKFRERKDDTEQLLRGRERVRRHRERLVTDGVTVTPCNPIQIQSTDTDSDTKPKSIVGLTPDTEPLSAKKLRQQAQEILEFLNQKTGRRYQPVKANIDTILARLKEGATVVQCRQVVARKCRDWLHDEKMSPYLRPATLFNRTKFWQYAGELTPEPVI